MEISNRPRENIISPERPSFILFNINILCVLHCRLTFISSTCEGNVVTFSDGAQHCSGLASPTSPAVLLCQLNWTRGHCHTHKTILYFFLNMFYTATVTSFVPKYFIIRYKCWLWFSPMAHYRYCCRKYIVRCYFYCVDKYSFRINISYSCWFTHFSLNINIFFFSKVDIFVQSK